MNVAVLRCQHFALTAYWCIQTTYLYPVCYYHFQNVTLTVITEVGVYKLLDSVADETKILQKYFIMVKIQNELIVQIEIRLFVPQIQGMCDILYNISL